MELHIAPVILGDGLRLLDTGGGLGVQEGIELSPIRVINTPEVSHIRYQIVGRSALGADYRLGSAEPTVA